MFAPKDTGWIEVICGSMFSGKTEELIRRIRRAEIARLPVQTFKPSLDDRYDQTRIVSHSSMSIPAEIVESSADIVERLDSATRVVGIDEAQFFDDGLVGQQVFAGEATRLAYMTDEAEEGRDAFLDKRAPDYSRFPWHF